MSFFKLCAAADRAMRRMPPPDLPDRWDEMSVGSLWDALNDPHRHGTPHATVDAVMYAVRARGVDALKEPANIERLSRCDAKARAEINRRAAAFVEKVPA
jgi:hypothetical protein